MNGAVRFMHCVDRQVTWGRVTPSRKSRYEGKLQRVSAVQGCKCAPSRSAWRADKSDLLHESSRHTCRTGVVVPPLSSKITKIKYRHKGEQESRIRMRIFGTDTKAVGGFNRRHQYCQRTRLKRDFDEIPLLMTLLWSTHHSQECVALDSMHHNPESVTLGSVHHNLSASRYTLCITTSTQHAGRLTLPHTMSLIPELSAAAA